jgi:hypothetical protein
MNEQSRLLPSPLDGFHSRSDDAVMFATKQLVDCWTITICLWLASFILTMINFISNGYIFQSISLLFLPMWIGSFYGIISLILLTKNLCSVSRLVTEEQLEYLEMQGQDSSRDYIEYESLPLLRYFFFYTVVSGLALLLVCISQVLLTGHMYIVLYLIFALGTHVSLGRGGYYRNVACT